MGRIHLLEDDVINKIAAGEVVERPVSVVKELMENALDAGATAIEVTLELGGLRSIVVTDNGCGMTPAEARLALRRHATSKLGAVDDLYHICTMGFRGEALAAIAAVSRLSLATVMTGEREGVKLTLAAEGGGEPLELPWQSSPGTTVAVENLFYNMPVRAKFMKAPATEFSHCLELVQAFALAHPHIAFTLRHNTKEHLRVPALSLAEQSEDGFGEQVLRERTTTLLGKEPLHYLQTSSRFGSIEALFSPPGVAKASGKSLFTFANGRLVKDRVLRYAVLRGYHSHLLKGRFPVVVLHLRCDPALIDVNVHPAKTEVRFQYPDEVQNLIALGLREALRRGTWSAPVPHAERQDPVVLAAALQSAPGARPVAPSAGLGVGSSHASTPPKASASGLQPMGERTFPGASFLRGPRESVNYQPGEAAQAAPKAAGRGGRDGAGVAQSVRSFGSDGSQRPSDYRAAPIFDKAGIDALMATPSPAFDDEPVATGPTAIGAASTPPLVRAQAALIPQAPATPGIAWEQMAYLGAIDRCYLLFAASGQLLAVDQHAFHERILYERLAADASLLKQSQKLLVPESLELSPAEMAHLNERSAALHARGFAFVCEGPTTLLVTAVPSLLAGRDLAQLMTELAQDLHGDETSEPTDSNAEMARLILATAACHAAVRAGEELPPSELQQLLNEARTVDFVDNCPHGRRVFKWWSRSEIAQWFDR